MRYLRLIPVLVIMIVFFQSSVFGVDKDKENINSSSYPVVIFNRTVADFRGTFLGVSPQERARRAEEVLGRILSVKVSKNRVVSLQKIPQGYMLMIDGALAFVIVAEDVDPLHQETPDQLAQRIVTSLEHVISETREARNLSFMLKSLAFAAAATFVLILLVWLLSRGRKWLVAKIMNLAHRHEERLTLGGESIVHRERMLLIVERAVNFIYWIMLFILVYDWLGLVLARFPYTRPWGERLTQYLIDVAMKIGKAVVSTIPELLVALLIFLMARFMIQLLGTMFDKIEQGKIDISWLDRDTVRPTRRLVSTAVWLFALAMAYPYLPGAGTEAFKGLSVLVGLMVSLGASSLVGQAASGLILMYTRTIRPGEYVQIASNEGTVVELGLFTTRIRTGLGEELTLPNSLILSNVSRNYSRSVKGDGYILDTTVTIGYDTPWRQVHGMLVEAAGRTNGVLPDPAPRVFQTALSDFYPEYRLVCQAIPSEPRPRAEVMNALHSNIQDVFNEYGVQIMSPHYRSDPEEAKVVQKENWYAPPAQKD